MKGRIKKYTDSPLYKSELQAVSDFLELINYRPGTIDGYLRFIFECCTWLNETYGISLNDADFSHLRAFLLHLKRSKADGGKGYAPRSVNVYNCALKKYFRFVLRRPLSDDELPLCRVDHPLPKVPSKKDAMNLIIGTRNIKHKAELAVAYGVALRIGEVSALRFRDISFTEGIISIPEDVSKSRYAGKVELPERLKKILLQYWRECCRGARPDDWLFPGQKAGSHVSTETLAKVFMNRIRELGWESRGYSFHSLRHGHALHYYQSGADLFQVQQRLRHRSISSLLVIIDIMTSLS